MKIIVSILIAFGLFANASTARADHHESNSGSPQWSDAQKEVWQAVLHLKDSYTADYNVGRFLAHFHDDFQGWYDGDTIPDDKTTLAKWAKNLFETRKTVYYKPLPISIRIHNDIALVYEIYSWSYKSPEGDRFERGHYAGVWKKENGKWLLFSETGGVDSLE